MTVEDSNSIDVISIDKKTGGLNLIISDHLAWNDSKRHQLNLQAKINSYLAYVESGEICERFPDARERLVTIKVVLRFKPDASGQVFLEKARKIVHSAGLGFQAEVFADSYDN